MITKDIKDFEILEEGKRYEILDTCIIVPLVDFIDNKEILIRGKNGRTDN